MKKKSFKQNNYLIDDDSKGKHNNNLSGSIERLVRGGSYKDLSTIAIVPSREPYIHMKVVSALRSLITPMNGKFFMQFVEGKEVGQAYNEAIDMILSNPDLSKWKYLLTLETDNIPPPDGLLKLYENMDKYDAIGGLYWTKGEGGQPMLYGNPYSMPKDFRPQPPIPNAIQPVNGLGMGFTLFKISMFKELRAKGVTTFFKTLQDFQYGVGARAMTQDLFFFELAGKEGYRFAGDNRVLVGHLDTESGVVW
jgi:hypothetical protein